MSWRKIEVLASELGHATDKGIIIRCPVDGEFSGWSYWVPKSLLRRGPDAEHHRLLVPSDAEYKLFRGEKDSREERTVSAPELVKAYGEVIDWNATRPLFFPSADADPDVEVIIRHTPKPLKAIVATVDAELSR